MNSSTRYAAVLLVLAAVAAPVSLAQNTRDVQASARMSGTNVIPSPTNNTAIGEQTRCYTLPLELPLLVHPSSSFEAAGAARASVCCVMRVLHSACFYDPALHLQVPSVPHKQFILRLVCQSSRLTSARSRKLMSSLARWLMRCIAAQGPAPSQPVRSRFHTGHFLSLLVRLSAKEQLLRLHYACCEGSLQCLVSIYI